MAFLVRSLKQQGALVEVVRNGKKMVVSIVKMGKVESEVVTDDMKQQKKYGFVDFVDLAPKKPAPLPMSGLVANPASPATVKIIAPTPSPSEVPLAVPPPEESKVLSEADLTKMSKSDLIELIEKYSVDIDPKQTKAALIEALAQEKLPKE